MSSYYKEVGTLLESFALNHLHIYLDKIVLSYITYDSVDFYDWLENNTSNEDGTFDRIKLIKVKIKKFIKEEVTLERTDFTLVNPIYATKEYIFIDDRSYLESGKNFASIKFKKLFDVWQNKSYYNQEWYVLASYVENKRQLFALIKFDHGYDTRIILAETIEQIYIHHETARWYIGESIIKPMIDSNDFGFLSTKFSDSICKEYKIIPLEFHHLIENVYYYVNDHSVFPNVYCGSDNHDGYIVRLKNGSWRAYGYWNRSNTIYYCMVAAIMGSCGINVFIKYQLQLFMKSR